MGIDAPSSSFPFETGFNTISCLSTICSLMMKESSNLKPINLKKSMASIPITTLAQQPTTPSTSSQVPARPPRLPSLFPTSRATPPPLLKMSSWLPFAFAKNEPSSSSSSSSKKKDIKGKGKEPAGERAPISSLLKGNEFKSVLGSRSVKSLGVKLIAHVLGLEDQDGQRLALPFLYLPDPDTNKRYYQTIDDPLCLEDIIDGLAVDETSRDFWFDEFEEVRDKIFEVCNKAQKWYEYKSKTHSDATRIKTACGVQFEILKNVLDDVNTPSRILSRPPAPKRHFEEIDPSFASGSGARRKSTGSTEASSSGQHKKQKSNHRVMSLNADPEETILEQAKQIEKLRRQLARSETDQQQSRSSLEVAEKKISSMDTKHVKLSKDLKDLETENILLDTELSSNATELAKAQTDTAHQHELNRLVIEERDRVTLEREKATKAFADVEVKVRSLEAQLATSQQTVERVREENQTLQVTIDELRAPHVLDLDDEEDRKPDLQQQQHRQQHQQQQQDQIASMLPHYDGVRWALDELEGLEPSEEANEFINDAKKHLRRMDALRDALAAQKRGLRG